MIQMNLYITIKYKYENESERETRKEHKWIAFK